MSSSAENPNSRGPSTVHPCNSLRIQVARALFLSAIFTAILPGSAPGAQAEPAAAGETPKSPAPPPPSVDLGPSFRAFGFKPRAQGERATCSVFVVTQAIEFAMAKREGRGRNLSVEFINWASNRGNKDRKDGGFFSDIWKGFQAHGICTEEAMPYRATYDPALTPSEETQAAAKTLRSKGLRLHWIKEWNPRKGLTDGQLQRIREVLARGWPVCGGFLWPKEEVWKDGTLRMCPREAVRDGHSVLLVGYRDDPGLPGGGVFLIWNTSGKLREGLLTYEYVMAYMNDAVWIDFEGR